VVALCATITHFAGSNRSLVRGGQKKRMTISRRYQAIVVLLGAAQLLAIPAAVTAQDSLRGFAAARVAGERQLESRLQKIPDPEHARSNLEHLTSAPHMAGTEGSRRVAQWLLQQYRADGFEAEIVKYSVWLPMPVESKLELLSPEKQALATPEDPIEGDKDTSDSRAVMAMNGFSPSGDVTGQVVYVNYGMEEDYRQLDQRGVSVEGKIAIARYGQGYRGVKALLAQEHKALGLLIYSDPGDDGFAAGDVLPRGPWRPISGIQRGSITYIQRYPGDPLTPGVAATPDAKRLAPEQAQSLPRIPTMPINARDAAAILSKLGGGNVPRAWQGGLPFTYHLGPGEAVVHLKIEMNYQQRELDDVIARLPGTDDNQRLVMGNHHDAWVFGAADPSSGTATMLETARALGQLAKTGWKPRRTIVMCEWDGEEPGLIGSTEWVEQHEKELQQRAIAYVNVDVAVTGPDFGASAVPSLKQFVRDVTRDVTDPRTGRSVYEVWKERVAHEQQSSGSGTARNEAGATPEGEVALGSLGSGSDFTPFLQHAGIPSLDMGSGGPYGVYHSIYDDFFWMQHFGDPTFAYHAEMSSVLGTLALRLEESDVLPFDYQAYAEEIQRGAQDLDGRARKEMPGNVDMRPVLDAAAAMKEASTRAQKTLSAMAANPPDAARLEKLNRALVEVEQGLLTPDGLKGRPWYKHTIYAPGTYTGYAALVMPGISEALDRKDESTAHREIKAAAEAIRRAAARLDEIAHQLAEGQSAAPAR
jgi:N-acetylated-alpha-linked acidic dipeptidase